MPVDSLGCGRAECPTYVDRARARGVETFA